MPPTQLVGLLSAITSALVWGSGDFAGGLAARRNAPSFVLMLASLTGFVILVPAAFLAHEAIPSGLDLLWSALAGISGGVGIAIFYRALAIGPAALVAPTAGVVGAAVPVLVAFLSAGLPKTGQLAGLVLGLAGIGLVSAGSSNEEPTSARPLPLALLAGLAFGGYFIFIAQVGRGAVFAPLAIAKLSALVLAVPLFLFQRRTLPPQSVGPLPFVSGILDAGGNLFYLLAIQYVRLDIAAVISSMYPGTTVLLARAIQHERMSRLQLLGIALCLGAVGLIAAA